jgi:hypothetical protein
MTKNEADKTKVNDKSGADGEYEPVDDADDDTGPDDHSFMLKMSGLARVQWEKDTDGNAQITKFFGKGKGPARPPFFNAKRMTIADSLLA